MDKGATLLELFDLRTEFAVHGRVVAAVDGVSLRVNRGETVVLLGESGCGKSTLALSIPRLLPCPPARLASGRMLLHAGSGEGTMDLAALPEKALRTVRGRQVAMIFQEPMTSLNPVLTAGNQIVEAIQLHCGLRGRAAWGLAEELMAKVGIADAGRRARQYPHQLSGGMRQRVMIAMALACQPLLLIADEPTTALDVTTQAQILALLRSLQEELGMSILLITHDLGVAAEMARRVYVMYAGRIVEHGPVASVLRAAAHPYTRGLLECTPSVTGRDTRLKVIPGSVPDPADFPPGCRFHPRCGLAEARATEGGRPIIQVDRGGGSVGVLASCRDGRPEENGGPPELREIGADHYAACWEI